MNLKQDIENGQIIGWLIGKAFKTLIFLIKFCYGYWMYLICNRILLYKFGINPVDFMVETYSFLDITWHNANDIWFVLSMLFFYGPVGEGINKIIGQKLFTAITILRGLQRFFHKFGINVPFLPKIEEPVFEKEENVSLEEIHKKNVELLHKKGSNDIYVGVYKKGRKWIPVITNSDHLKGHTHVIGTTSSGKSESVLKSWLYQRIMNHEGGVFIDPKGDSSLRSEMIYLTRPDYGWDRNKDFFYIGFTNQCKHSMTYNPLENGDASQIANRFFNSFEWQNEYYKGQAFNFFAEVLDVLKRNFGEIFLADMLKFVASPKECVSEKLLNSIASQSDKEILARRAKTNPENLSGLYDNISMLCRGSIGEVFKGSQLKIPDIVEGNKVLLVQAPTSTYKFEAQALGRMIVQEVNFCASMRNESGRDDHHFYPLIVDEFNSFLFKGFMDLLKKLDLLILAVYSPIKVSQTLKNSDKLLKSKFLKILILSAF